MITVPKRPLFLVLPYIGQLQLETTAKLRKSFKGTLNCSKLQILFKSQSKLSETFHFKRSPPQRTYIWCHS